MRRTKTLAERFWAKVDRGGPVPAHCPELGPCWVWTAAKNEAGYGVIGRGSRGLGNQRAHRVSWQFAGHSIDGVLVLHRCDNPPCVNPAHLFAGDHAANTADRVAKGRTVARTGEANGRSKLTDEQRAELRRLYAEGWGYRRLGARFGIHRVAARYVATGKGSYADQIARRGQRTP